MTHPPLLRIILSEARAEVRKLLREPAFLWPTLIFPWAFYLLFGHVLKFGSGMGHYLLPTYGVFGIIAPALFGFGVGVAQERAQGWMLLKQASPMPPSAYFAAKLLMAMAFASVVVAGLLALAYGVVGVDLSMTGAAQLSLVLILGTIPFCALGLMVGYWVRANAAVAVVNLIYLPMAVLSGLWFPLFLFPETFQTLAWLLPPFHLAQLGLKVVGMDAGHPWWSHASILIAFAVVFSLLALVAYRRDDGQGWAT